jgi:hypothetical protein
MCQLLLDLGAVADPVTKRQETPLLLATRSDCQHANFRDRSTNGETACLNTVKVLVEQGQNDPMQCDDVGWTPIFTASKNRSRESLLWLVHQDDYEVDLNYSTPEGTTTAAFFARRGDMCPTLFEPLLQKGIAINGPCAAVWGPKFASAVLKIKGTMMFPTLRPIVS